MSARKKLVLCPVASAPPTGCDVTVIPVIPSPWPLFPNHFLNQDGENLNIEGGLKVLLDSKLGFFLTKVLRSYSTQRWGPRPTHLYSTSFTSPGCYFLPDNTMYPETAHCASFLFCKWIPHQFFIHILNSLFHSRCLTKTIFLELVAANGKFPSGFIWKSSSVARHAHLVLSQTRIKRWKQPATDQSKNSSGGGDRSENCSRGRGCSSFSTFSSLEWAPRLPHSLR